QHDILLNEKPLLTPVKRPASDLFTLVADDWVRIESRLFLSPFRRLNVGGRLREGRIVLHGHLLQFVEGDRFLLGSWRLRSTRQGEQKQSPGNAEYESDCTGEW